MKNYFLMVLLALGSALPVETAYADGGDGFGQVFNVLFGSRDAKQKLQTCEDGGSNSGLIGVVNSFFCHMEKDMGITGPTSGVTKVFNDSGGAMSVRAQIIAGDVVISGVTYSHQARVWVCTTGCTLAANFARAIYIAFSYDKDALVNKGYLLMEPDRFDGGSSSALKLIYNVGESVGTKTIVAHGKFSDGATTIRMYADGSKSSNVTSITVLMHDSTNGGMRVAARVNESSNVGGVYFEAPVGAGFSGSGVATVNNSAANDDKSASAMCFSRQESTTDYSYSPAGGTCTLPTFPNKTITDLSDDSQGDVIDYTGLMDANPSSI